MSNELYARLLEAQWQRPMTIVPPPTWHQLAKQLLRIPPKPVVAISKSELKKLIIEQIQTYGPSCDLNHMECGQREDDAGNVRRFVFFPRYFSVEHFSSQRHVQDVQAFAL